MTTKITLQKTEQLMATTHQLKLEQLAVKEFIDPTPKTLFTGEEAIINSQFPNSTSLVECSYDQVYMLLKVTFKSGESYVYEGVDPETHNDLLSANSAGSHFHKFIKNKFNFIKLPKLIETKEESVVEPLTT